VSAIVEWRAKDKLRNLLRQRKTDSPPIPRIVE
jgi:hypothetical protein